MSMYNPPRGGSRGGQDQFDWEDVKADKHRENYLGHSLKASVGRWQKGKDLTWYTKASKVTSKMDRLKQEVAAVKRAEEEAMAAALGLKPSGAAQPQATLSRQELAEVCRRRSTEEADEGEERLKGVGFQSRRAQTMYGGTQGTTTKEGMTIFEHDDPSREKGEGRLRLTSGERERKRRSGPEVEAPPTKLTRGEGRGGEREVEGGEDGKESSKHRKKQKKEKKSKKHKRERRPEREERERRPEREEREGWPEREGRPERKERDRRKRHSSAERGRSHSPPHRGGEPEREWGRRRRHDSGSD